ncbi:MAG: hypothetical protein ACP5NG_01005 [Conexivisphaera sp.]
MREFLNPERRWTVRVAVEGGEESVELYEVRDSVKLEKESLDRMIDLVRNRDNYAAIEAIKSVSSPEGDEYGGFAVFMVVLKLLEEAGQALGDVHEYLFGVSAEDGNLVLLASSDQDSSRSQFLGCMSALLDDPESVDMAIIALPIREADSAPPG